jgi:hypothetical protein
LKETRGQKTREHTDQHLLNKRRVHPPVAAAAMPDRASFTRIPTVGSA